MTELLENWINALQIVLQLVLVLWLIAIVNHITGGFLNQYGLYPRDLDGLYGVVSWVFLHAGFGHLIMNTMPLLYMGFFVALRGSRLFFKISVTVAIVAGFAVWCLGRPAIHIGASGLVFGYFGFLVTVALIERRIFDLLVASVTIFYYGGLIFGVLPTDAFVSWEGHLFGLAAGVLAANWYSKDWVAPKR